MGLCSDQSISYLRDLGYNVVRHPNAIIKSLDLIGVQDGGTNYLGPLNLLITNAPGPLPIVAQDIPAANINGQASSKLTINIGINILGSLIAAMGGGNLGANLSYTNAKTIQFQYTDVLNDQVVPLEVGNYLRDGQVDAGNLILKQYVLGDGDLFVITKTAKSKKFTVSFELSNGAGANVDVPVIQGVAGGSVKVSGDTQRKHLITFEGSQPLIFGFQCFQVGVTDGKLSLTSVKPGKVAMAIAGSDEDKPALLTNSGLLNLK